MLFAVALVAGVVAVLGTVLWYISIYQSGNSSFTGMMGQMMGNSPSNNNGVQTMPQYVWWFIMVLFIVAALSVVGVAYYLIFPEIRRSPASPVSPSSSPESRTSPVSNGETVSDNHLNAAKHEENATQTASWPVLIKTSKPEERKVLEILAAHSGRYLQKLLVKESGLSKLKTHRIVSRFAERGIITVTKTGNTNEIVLADWLKTSGN